MAANLTVGNKTGKNISPLKNEELAKFAESTPPDIKGNAKKTIMQSREESILEADPIGSIPFPDFKDQGFKKIEPTSLEAMLIDKIGERIAFERMGIRLYEALIAKLTSLQVTPSTLDILKNFQKEEGLHLNIVTEAMLIIGGDPTAETPCADITAVASAGILKVITDPRTNAAQSFQALLAAELIDTSSWELLIILVEKTKNVNLLNNFRQAYAQESIHQETIKSFLIGLINGDL